MTRKLRNSLTALLLASSACMLGALTVAALPLGFHAAAPASKEQPAVVDMDAAQPEAPRTSGRSHRMRPSLGMPYFSFVPRG